LSYGYIRYKLVPVVKGKLSCNYYDQKFLIMSKKHDLMRCGLFRDGKNS
jgi:hypothetical protein